MAHSYFVPSRSAGASKLNEQRLRRSAKAPARFENALSSEDDIEVDPSPLQKGSPPVPALITAAPRLRKLADYNDTESTSISIVLLRSVSTNNRNVSTPNVPPLFAAQRR